MSYSYTATHSIRRMEYNEIKQLQVGDKIHILVYQEFIEATVVRPMFWNSDADEPDWEVETDCCFTDIYSIYKIKKL